MKKNSINFKQDKHKENHIKVHRNQIAPNQRHKGDRGTVRSSQRERTAALGVGGEERRGHKSVSCGKQGEQGQRPPQRGESVGSARAQRTPTPDPWSL